MIPASTIYEIVVEDPSGPKSWWRMLVITVVAFVSMGAGPSNPGGMIISVRRKDDGEEVFRHIEDFGDDQGHLLDGIEKDLASMTATDFEATWVS